MHKNIQTQPELCQIGFQDRDKQICMINDEGQAAEKNPQGDDEEEWELSPGDDMLLPFPDRLNQRLRFRPCKVV